MLPEELPQCLLVHTHLRWKIVASLFIFSSRVARLLHFQLEFRATQSFVDGTEHMAMVFRLGEKWGRNECVTCEAFADSLSTMDSIQSSLVLSRKSFER